MLLAKIAKSFEGSVDGNEGFYKANAQTQNHHGHVPYMKLAISFDSKPVLALLFEVY